MHHMRLIAAIVLILFAVGGALTRAMGPAKSGAEPYEEVSVLTPERRDRLAALRRERKFKPDDRLDPPYPGPPGPKAEARLSAAIDSLIDDILGEADGPLEASDVAGRLGLAIAAVNRLKAPDVERAHGYMIEVWYILGFRSATGYFARADGATPLPEGYGEPLPPGWAGPDAPRR